MKLQEISEMTMNNYVEQTDEKALPYFEYLTQHGQHIGDQDGLAILCTKFNDTILYGIKQNDTITTIITFKIKNNTTWILHVAHTLTRYRGKRHILKLLWFIKSQEGKSIIDYGSQTNDGIRLVKTLALSNRFELSWYNIRTNEKQPYNAKTDNTKNTPYRQDHKMTDWRILIEGDEYPSFDRYDTDLVKGMHPVFA